jgi:phage tail sheath protein FI
MSQINETAIRTPGVYTTEIPTLPPSVAQVSTAVPAFIGYTRTALDAAASKQLTNLPTKIFSLGEYEQYFGLPEDEAGIAVAVNIDTTNDPAIPPMTANATIANPSVHNMYYCIRHYFNNGGGPCYIVSVGPTGGGLNPQELEGTVPGQYGRWSCRISCM